MVSQRHPFVYSQGEASGYMPPLAISTRDEIRFILYVFKKIRYNKDAVVLVVRQQTVQQLKHHVRVLQLTQRDGAGIDVTTLGGLQEVMNDLYTREYRSIDLVLSAEVGQLPPTQEFGWAITIDVHRCVRGSDEYSYGLKTMSPNNRAPLGVRYFLHSLPTTINGGNDASDDASVADLVANVSDDASDNVSHDVSEDHIEDPDLSANENLDENINDDINGDINDDINEETNNDAKTGAKSMDWGNIGATTAGALVGTGVAVAVGAAALPAAGLVAAGSLVAGALYYVPWRNLFGRRSGSPGEEPHEKSQPPVPPPTGPTSETKDSRKDSRTKYLTTGAVIVLGAVLVVVGYSLGLIPAVFMVASWLVSTFVVCCVSWATIYDSIVSDWRTFKSNLWSALSKLRENI